MRLCTGRRELVEALYAERIMALCEAAEMVDGEPILQAVFDGLRPPSEAEPA